MWIESGDVHNRHRGGGGSRDRSRKVMAAFKRYKIAAFVVGWGLLILCAAMVFKYAFDMPQFVAI